MRLSVCCQIALGDRGSDSTFYARNLFLARDASAKNGAGISRRRARAGNHGAMAACTVMNSCRERSGADETLSLRFRDTIFPAKMEREAAIRLLRALIAAGLRQRESMANAAIRSVADQA